MDFLKKLQNQPEHIRRLILWLTVVLVGLGLAIWWVYSSFREIKEFPKEEFIKELNFPSFEEEFKEVPEIESPENKEQ